MWSSAWLAVRSLAWAVALPGVFAGYLPWRYLGLREVRLDALEPAQIPAVVCIGVGIVLLAACIVVQATEVTEGTG